MQVAFYAPLKPPDHPTPSGDRRIGRLLLAALVAAGHEPFLASRFRSREPAGDVARQARLAELGEKLARRLLRRWQAEGVRPDVWLTYHLYYKAPDWIGPLVAGALGIPYVVVEASYAPKRAGGPWDLAHRAVAVAVRKAAAVVSLNPNDRACLALLVASEQLYELAPFLALSPSPAKLAPHPREGRNPCLRGESQAPNPAGSVQAWAPASARAGEEARAGKDGGAREALAATRRLDLRQPWLLAVGMMRTGDKLASFRLLADALTQLQDRPWQLLIAGDGEARGDVEAAFRPLGARVRLLGLQDEAGLARLYTSADLFVWPAHREAFGMALLEAQAAGLPVVAGRTGGVPTVVAHRQTGLLVSPGNASIFAAAVASLLDNFARREAMGLAAREKVLAHHSLANAARRLDAILRGVMYQS